MNRDRSVTPPSSRNSLPGFVSVAAVALRSPVQIPFLLVVFVALFLSFHPWALGGHAASQRHSFTQVSYDGTSHTDPVPTAFHEFGVHVLRWVKLRNATPSIERTIPAQEMIEWQEVRSSFRKLEKLVDSEYRGGR